MHSYYFIFVTYVYLVLNIFTSNRKRTIEYFSSLTAIGAVFLYFWDLFWFDLVSAKSTWKQNPDERMSQIRRKRRKNGERGKAGKPLRLSLLAEAAAWAFKTKAERTSSVRATLQLSGASKHL